MMFIVSLKWQIYVEDKIALCSGEDFWNTKEMPQYEPPTFKMMLTK